MTTSSALSLRTYEPLGIHDIAFEVPVNSSLRAYTVFIPLIISVYLPIPEPVPSFPVHEKTILHPPVSVLPLAGVMPETTGAVLSIHVIVASISLVFPTRSEKLKVKLPLPVNKYQVDHPFVVTVTQCLK
jgi:hypothetical protein